MFNLNETVIVNNINYTVTDVQHSNNPATVNNSGFTKPIEGNEFVLVTIKIENKSDKKISYSSFNWKMQNSLGQETDAKYTKDFDSGELLKSGIKEGIIIFEQPIGDGDLKLNFYNNTLFDDSYVFQIDL
ncbi:MAG: DUF4352 domain-containing protein [Candidatus Pacebacteria bacterium]|nr:DUF4352 domain-containing protein [Candidatus Paceibacterota bacterium]